ncbi:MAG: BMC domain-containing protein [Desulfovibrionaceae bacterium]|nr:BMC domain-containing protein [Desulfovibrionaceae bacterium]
MDTLGVVESRGIAAGAELADGMVKAGQVELIRAGTICSGRFLIFVSGDRAAVEAAVSSASESGRPLAGSFVISHISPLVMAALKRAPAQILGTAVAVVECRNVSSGVVAADRAVKRSDVQIARFVAGQGINGKSYFVLTGDVAAVREASDAARESLGGHLLDLVVIPAPDPAVARALINGLR